MRTIRIKRLCDTPSDFIRVLIVVLGLALTACGNGSIDGVTSDAGSATAAPQPLRLAGPAAVVSFPLMHMATHGIDVGGQRRSADFQLWQNPDQLRVLLARNEVDYSAAPANLPALMANRGEPVRLLNVSVWGLLWLISRDPEVRGFADLRGRTLLSPFQRDMGAIVVGHVLEAGGMGEAADLQLRHTRTSLDAISLMLAGKADTVVLSEPTASLLLLRDRSNGSGSLQRVQSVEAVWAEHFPQVPELPQAGVMAAAHVASDSGLEGAVVKAYASSAAWCKSDPDACAALVHGYLPHMPVEALAESIRVTRLDGLPTASVRPQLEALYRLMLESEPEALGGRMPNDDFYAQ